MAKKNPKPSAIGGSGNTYSATFGGKGAGIDYNSHWTRGYLDLIDHLAPGDQALVGALTTYADYMDGNRHSLLWQRCTRWTENMFFVSGRHYLTDLLTTRLSKDADENLSVVREVANNIPKPTNDLLGRYVETNVALLTENRPRPRITAKSDNKEDKDAAELSELTIEYLWEALDMPHKTRQLARLLLTTGVAWLETYYDPTKERKVAVPMMEESPAQAAPLGVPEGVAPPVQTQVSRPQPMRDANGRLQYSDEIEYGDIVSNIVSPFEMHLPNIHWWNSEEMGWVMREYYTSREQFIDKYSTNPRKRGLTKKNGWYLDRLDNIGTMDVQNLPIWWWERLGQIVEGTGPTFWVGNPELWKDHVVVRILDRKPSIKWPRGRTIIVAGGQVIYDSPKDVGARAYDPRWPDRWHPYQIFRWEPLPSTDVYCRSLVSKLLPKIKRVNAIDTTLIMWRRTVPIATWVIPKGSQVVEDQWQGGGGSNVWEYDPRMTAGGKPEPAPPIPFPQAALDERNTQIAEMEAIAGTEEILRGQRPVGVTNASMLEVLRKQALASRSAILQGWDESLQGVGTTMLQEVIKNIGDDQSFAEGIRILAREKASRRTIAKFSGENLSDNVNVRVDTASMALVSQEARASRAMELLQYGAGLMQIPYAGLRDALVEELGWPKSLTPQGPDIDRAKRLMELIRSNNFERVIPFPEDDPYVIHELLVAELKADTFFDLSEFQQGALAKVIDIYSNEIKKREQAAMARAMAMQGMPGPGEGGVQ